MHCSLKGRGAEKQGEMIRPGKMIKPVSRSEGEGNGAEAVGQHKG